MNDSHDPRLAPVGRRLERRVPAEPAPTLRHRVLMAVDDVLEKKVPATKTGEDGRTEFPSIPVLVAGTFLGAGAALAASVVVSMVPASHIQPLTLSERMRIACVADDGSLAAMVASSADGESTEFASGEDGSPHGPAAVRVRAIDARRLLEETL